MNSFPLVRSVALAAALASLPAFADLEPIAPDAKEMAYAHAANGIFNLKQVRSGERAYKLVTMDTPSNGDVNVTSILLTGEEVGGEAGFESAFLLSPRYDAKSDVEVTGAHDLEPTADGVELTYTDGDGVEMKRTLKFDAATSTLKEGAAKRSAKCDELTATNDVYQCLVSENTEADKSLNAAYQKALKGADAVGKKKLQTAEKAWIAYRDAVCAAEADQMRGGSYEKVLRFGCLVRMTKDRTSALLTN